jgi:IS605 OrfB family transposase
LENIAFKYGADVIREAMRKPQALSYRFLRNEKGWRVMVTTNLPDIKTVSVKTSGAIGVDQNADCLAVSETDHFGNLVNSWIVPLVTYGKSTDQAKAIIGDAVKAVVDIAAKALKPIVIEKLDFSKKKAVLEAENPKYARMLSSFSCNKIVQNIKSRAHLSGIEVIEVNPAYTSTIGAVNYVQRYGISTHQAAAFAIARRGLRLSEKPVKRPVVQVRNGGHVALLVPVRKPLRHVWAQWSGIRDNLSAVHVAHARSGECRISPAPLRRISFAVALCPTWALSVRSRHANRQQNCSAGVVEEDVIPW